jgi:hypothetical protein
MKKNLYVFVLCLMASCSSPKYTANFNYYKSNSGYAGGYGELKTKETIIAPIEPSKLIASTDEKMIILEEAPAVNEVRKTYIQMNKTERKALRQYLKKEMKTMVKAKKNESVESVSSTKAMEHDLKLAAIFGAVGIVGLIIGGDVFYIIGAIALLIGVVFFVKWLVRQ